jgi:CRP/FNR family transcriptional regulator, anaerobic regulatory protein
MPKSISENGRFPDPALLSGHLGDLFQTLEPSVRTELMSAATFNDVSAGTVLISVGIASTDLGYVISGTLAMTRVVDDCRKHIIGLLAPTDLYCRLFDGACDYSIEALTDAQVCCFDRANFEHILRQQPEAERLFLAQIMEQIDNARDWLMLISERKVIHRSAALLAMLARRVGPLPFSDSTVVRLPLQRKELAQYLGTTPESLSRSFHQMQKLGIITIIDPQNFLILDLAALAELSGNDMGRVECRATGR